MFRIRIHASGSAQYSRVHFVPSSLLSTMIEMLGDAYNALSQVILHTPVFPILWTAHCLLMCRAVRAVTGEQVKSVQHTCLRFRRTGVSPNKSVVIFVDFYYLHLPRGYIITIGSRKSCIHIPDQHQAVWQLYDHLVPDELHKTQLPKQN